MAFGRYGAWRYGEADYGEGYSETSSSAPEGVISQAKDTTVFLCRDSDVDDDMSQYLTDLTASGSAGYESASTRADIDGTGAGRGLCVVFQWDTSGVLTTLLRHGSDAVAGNHTYAISVDASDVVSITGDGVTIASVALPGAGVGTETFMVCASTFPNPDSTGASNELITTLSAHNVDEGTWAHAQAAHAVYSGSSYTLSVGGRWTGAAMTETATSLIAARVDNAYVSAAEYSEDFGYDARPTGDETRTAVRREPARPGSAAFAADEYLGAGNVGWAGHATRANDLRLAGPVGGVYLQNSAGSTGIAFVELATLDARYGTVLGGFTYTGGLIYPLVCSASVSRIRIRAHVQSWVTSGSAQPLTLRALSATRNPFAAFQSFGQGAQSLRTSRADIAINTDHGSAQANTGGWYDFGELELSINPPLAQGPADGLTGLTWLLFGYRLDGGDSTLQRLRIKAIHWWPVVVDDANGGTQPGTGPDTSGIIQL